MGGDQPNLWRAFHVGGLYNTGKVHWALALESLTSLATGSPDREVIKRVPTSSQAATILKWLRMQLCLLYKGIMQRSFTT